MTPTSRSASIAGLELSAPIGGVVVPLDRVPDAAFAQRLAGDGVAIDPVENLVVAPCDATVTQVHRARHAITLDAAGIDLIIHVGLDTVTLKGEGFTPRVQAGAVVRRGDPLLDFDADFIARRGKPLMTVLLVSSMDRVDGIEVAAGTVHAGRDAVMRIGLRPGDGAEVVRGGEAITGAPIRLTAETGLHARPAAVLAAAARRFTADIRLLRAGREANARSVVSIMALEAAHGDEVTVQARGGDAAAAVQEISRLLTTSLAADHAPSPIAPPRAPAAAPIPAPDGALAGVPASPGVAVGTVFQFRPLDLVAEQRAADANQERRALDTAIAAARLQLETLQARLAAEADADRAAIFAAHQELLEDPEVLDRAAAEIRAGAAAAWAWQQAFTSQADRLAALPNPLLAARATDLRDVGRRVLHLLAGREAAAPPIPPGSIVVAEDLSPSDTASLDRTHVRGVCTTMGSATSHAAILARGLGIPAIAGVDPRVLDLPNGTRVLLDADRGTITRAPSADAEARVVARQEADARRRAGEMAMAMEPATTRDGHRVEVAANLGDVADAHRVVEVGGDGVGLLRSEFLFLDRRTAPDEEEQASAYGDVARALGRDRLLVIRTLDVGGDKPLAYLPMGAEANPFLGERGIRLTLNRPELFRAQIRAILRASAQGKVAMMFPMVATLAEWRAGRAMVEDARVALGLPPIPVGIMVETAAAALLAERFAREADFFSIGTNDLTQYTLAMDRGNPRLAPQVDALHPAVLKLIHMTVQGAHAHGRWVGVCGALAGDLAAAPVLIGLGVDELSADIPLVPAVKARIRGLSIAECRVTARDVLEAEDGAEVRAIVARRHG
ncbi:MAG: phosphoenolpyruvate--protein phosphotransferase [Gemmatimonadaceae bacterium]